MTSPPLNVPLPDLPALPAGPITWEEFLAWDRGEWRAEWVDGEVVLLSPDNLPHFRLAAFIFHLVGTFVRSRNLGEVFMGTVLMRLRTRPSGRVPDVLFVSAEHANRLHDTFIDGPADVVVEIVSPDSTVRDRAEKFVEYEGGGVPEYWLIDPLRQEAIFYQLGADQRYRPAPPDADGWYHSSVLRGFRLKVAWLWQQPLPSVDEIRCEVEA